MTLVDYLRPRRTRSITLSTVAAALTVSPGIQAVRLRPTVDCWVTIAATAVTAVNGDATVSFPVLAALPEIWGVNPGDTISAVAAGAGTLSVLEMGR